VEYKVQIRVEISDHISNILIKLDKLFLRSIGPRLINRFKGIGSWMVSPSLKNFAYVIKSPINIFVIDIVIALSFHVPITNPVSSLNFPMLEVVLVDPFKVMSLSRIIIPILRILKSMDIKENLDSVLISSIKEPLDLISSAISAPNIRTVGFENPVTDGQPDNFNFSLGKSLNMILSDPGIPMSSKNLVSFLRSELLTERVLINADTFTLSLTQESVEE